MANITLGTGQEERFFNKLEDDVNRIIEREKRREQYANSQGLEVSTSTEHEPVSQETHVQIFHTMLMPVLATQLCWLH